MNEPRRSMTYIAENAGD